MTQQSFTQACLFVIVSAIVLGIIVGVVSWMTGIPEYTVAVVIGGVTFLIGAVGNFLQRRKLRKNF